MDGDIQDFSFQSHAILLSKINGNRRRTAVAFPRLSERSKGTRISFEIRLTTTAWIRTDRRKAKAYCGFPHTLEQRRRFDKSPRIPVKEPEGSRTTVSSPQGCILSRPLKKGKQNNKRIHKGPPMHVLKGILNKVPANTMYKTGNRRKKTATDFKNLVV